MQYIYSSDVLDAFCKQLAGESYVTIDTEFHREKTYYPDLCLIQIAGEKEAAIIDPLADGMDLSPLYDLLADPNVLKVMHACRQDMEIFVQATKGRMPAPIFDTQIAGMVLGFGESVSYDTLVRHYAKTTLDKSSRFTDWMKRPLTDAQLKYAIGDVTHLRVVFEKMEAELEKTGRNEWLVEEMQALSDPSLYMVSEDECWIRLKFRQTAPRYLAVLQSIARWREREAQRKNVPRGRLIKDDSLVEIAAQKPTSITELRKMRAYAGTLNDSQCTQLLAALEEGMRVPDEECPVWREKKSLPDHMQMVVELLKLLLKQVALKENTVSRLIASQDELEKLATGQRDVRMLQGWRYDVFGERALAMLEGKCSVRYNPESKRVVFE